MYLNYHIKIIIQPVISILYFFPIFVKLSRTMKIICEKAIKVCERISQGSVRA